MAEGGPFDAPEAWDPEPNDVIVLSLAGIEAGTSFLNSLTSSTPVKPPPPLPSHFNSLDRDYDGPGMEKPKSSRSDEEKEAEEDLIRDTITLSSGMNDESLPITIPSIHRHTLSNKYYTCQLHFHLFDSWSMVMASGKDASQAVMVLLDQESQISTSILSQALKQTQTSSNPYEVALVLGNTPPQTPATDAIEDVCDNHQFEFVSIQDGQSSDLGQDLGFERPVGEARTGISRVFEALHACQWDHMKMNNKNNNNGGGLMDGLGGESAGKKGKMKMGIDLGVDSEDEEDEEEEREINLKRRSVIPSSTDFDDDFSPFVSGGSPSEFNNPNIQVTIDEDDFPSESQISATRAFIFGESFSGGGGGGLSSGFGGRSRTRSRSRSGTRKSSTGNGKDDGEGDFDDFDFPDAPIGTFEGYQSLDADLDELNNNDANDNDGGKPLGGEPDPNDPNDFDLSLVMERLKILKEKSLSIEDPEERRKFAERVAMGFDSHFRMDGD